MKYMIDGYMWNINGNEQNAIFRRALQILNSFDFHEKEWNHEVVTLEINEDTIVCKFNKVQKVYKEISKTDVYPILYSLLYELEMKECRVFAHSVVVYKEKNGLLILGDFHSGKTTLGNEFEKIGWKMVAADQSILMVRDNSIMLYKGSKSQYDAEKCLDEKRVPLIKIKNVVLIRGLTVEGDVKVDNITGFNNIYRGTWSNFVWPWYTPLTNRMELIQLNDKYVKKLYNFFDQFSKLKFYSARGDSNGVAHFLDNLISKKFDY